MKLLLDIDASAILEHISYCLNNLSGQCFGASGVASRSQCQDFLFCALVIVYCPIGNLGTHERFECRQIYKKIAFWAVSCASFALYIDCLLACNQSLLIRDWSIPASNTKILSLVNIFCIHMQNLFIEMNASATIKWSGTGAISSFTNLELLPYFQNILLTVHFNRSHHNLFSNFYEIWVKIVWCDWKLHNSH